MIERIKSFHALCKRSAARFLGEKDLDHAAPDDLTALKGMVA